MLNAAHLFLALLSLLPFIASAFTTPATIYSVNQHHTTTTNDIFPKRNHRQPLYTTSSVNEEETTTIMSEQLMEVCTKAANALDDAVDAVANTEELFAVDATFDCQAPGLAGITTAKGYAEFMEGLAKWGPGPSYDIHNQVWDETTKSAMFFCTYHVTHTAEGGPVEPTGKTADSHYVYVMKTNDDGKISNLTKIWNDGYAFKQLGWA